MEFAPYCIICGVIVSYRLPDLQWESEFRAVRVRDEEQSPFLTGVGGLMNGYFAMSAPSDPDQRYDDPDYQVSPADDFSAHIGNESHPMPGFVFHEVCWELLVTFLYPHRVSLRWLYEICRSFPMLTNGLLLWGHHYGGCLKTNKHRRHLWEEECPRSFWSRPEYWNTPGFYCDYNPLEIPGLQAALNGAQQNGTTRNSAQHNIISEVFRKEADRFLSFPVEIREYIQNKLHSRDVANIRLASRSFASIPLSQSFWRSRFCPNQEKYHIFEARELLRSKSSGNCDWEYLYFATEPEHYPSLGNRQRIWECNISLVNLLSAEPLTSDGINGMKEYNHVVWRTVGGSPVNYMKADILSRESLYERAVRVPEKLSQISVSMAVFNEKQYVSGFRILAPGKKEIILGYIFPGQEVTLDIAADDGEPSTLTGFIVAANITGIRAIRAVTQGGHKSQWVGDQNSSPGTLRLCMNERITHLKAGLDGFKMVSLSVPEEEPIHETRPSVPLRKTAFWYPSIPSKHITLDKFIFISRDAPLFESQPLIYLKFGGPRGTYLEYLTSISAIVQGGSLYWMDFEYECKDAPVECLGAELGGPSSPRMSTFDIDGPGGERITGIQVKGNQPKGPRTARLGICSLKIFTNRDRFHTFEPDIVTQLKLHHGPEVVKRVDIDPDMTLTGIYAAHDHKIGLLGLGTMSENLSPTYNSNDGELDSGDTS